MSVACQAAACLLDTLLTHPPSKIQQKREEESLLCRSTASPRMALFHLQTSSSSARSSASRTAGYLQAKRATPRRDRPRTSALRSGSAGQRSVATACPATKLSRSSISCWIVASSSTSPRSSAAFHSSSPRALSCQSQREQRLGHSSVQGSRGGAAAAAGQRRRAPAAPHLQRRRAVAARHPALHMRQAQQPGHVRGRHLAHVSQALKQRSVPLRPPHAVDGGAGWHGHLRCRLRSRLQWAAVGLAGVVMGAEW